MPEIKREDGYSASLMGSNPREGFERYPCY
jgi:hypothetical protein